MISADDDQITESDFTLDQASSPPPRLTEAGNGQEADTGEPAVENGEQPPEYTPCESASSYMQWAILYLSRVVI